MDDLPSCLPVQWSNLPVRVTPQDVVSIFLLDEEIDVIREYTDRMFDKATIDKTRYIWNSAKGLNKKNPNMTGIKGEWAGVKYFAPYTTLQEFLNDRPWKMADMGDAIIGEKNPMIFDYKTRTRKESVETMLTGEHADTWMAEISHKYANTDKYGYLQAFIFCVNDEPNNMIHLMGWLSAEDLFANAQLIREGHPVPNFFRPYDVDMLFVPYRRLRPILELQTIQYFPISQDLTLSMRQDWNTTQQFDIRKYVSGM